LRAGANRLRKWARCSPPIEEPPGFAFSVPDGETLQLLVFDAKVREEKSFPGPGCLRVSGYPRYMMRLSLQTIYRSLSTLEDIDLPSFALLTGLNGSGKSHLLEAIEQGNVSVEIDGQTIPRTLIKRFDSLSLSAGDAPAADPVQLVRARTAHWNTYVALVNQSGWVSQLRQAATNDQDRNSNSTDSDLYEWGLSLVGQTEQICGPNVRACISNWANFEPGIRHHLEANDSIKPMLRHFEAETGKSIVGICKQEFEHVAHSAPVEVEPFKQKLSEVFSLYAKLRDRNVLMRHHEEPSLSEDEFQTRHGVPPWDYLNELLEIGGYDFSVTKPAPRDGDEPFVAKLIHKFNGASIDFGSLSSGERVLIALAMCVYSTENGSIKVNYPKVMLFDEVDAFLHPSMVQSLFDVVKKVLVEKHGLHVVLTTHSPTSVALADPAGIFKMVKDGARIGPCSRQEGIDSLTVGIPTLSVNLENRRAVFVEDKNDIALLTKLGTILVPHCPGPFEPIFLSTSVRTNDGTVGGGKAPLEEVVKGLRNAGLTSAFGLRDADAVGIASNSDGVLLLGSASRYAIENFILDPLLIAALLNLRKFHDHVTPEGMGLSGTGFLGGIENLITSELQSAADAVLYRVGPPSESPDLNRTDVELLSGSVLSLPNWFMAERGHDWAERVRERIPQLKSCGSEQLLMVNILDLIVEREPRLISKDLVDTLTLLRS
jgi:AAA domain, putative AbiEii toxin, Type IV TA system